MDVEVSAMAATAETVAMARDMARMVVPMGTDSVDAAVSDAVFGVDPCLTEESATLLALTGLAAVDSDAVVVLHRGRINGCVKESLRPCRRTRDDAQRSDVTTWGKFMLFLLEIRVACQKPVFDILVLVAPLGRKGLNAFWIQIHLPSLKVGNGHYDSTC